MSNFSFFNDFDILSDDEIILKISQKYQSDNELLPFYYYDICVNSIVVGKISIFSVREYHTVKQGHFFNYSVICLFFLVSGIAVTLNW